MVQFTSFEGLAWTFWNSSPSWTSVWTPPPMPLFLIWGQMFKNTKQIRQLDSLHWSNFCMEALTHTGWTSKNSKNSKKYKDGSLQVAQLSQALKVSSAAFFLSCRPGRARRTSPRGQDHDILRGVSTIRSIVSQRKRPVWALLLHPET